MLRNNRMNTTSGWSLYLNYYVLYHTYNIIHCCEEGPEYEIGLQTINEFVTLKDVYLILRVLWEGK